MHAEDTLDPSHAATRRIESMSDLVAEMVLGACGEDDSNDDDAGALEAARSIVIAPAPPARCAATALAAPRPEPRPRGRSRVLFFAVTGALFCFGGVIALFLTLR